MRASRPGAAAAALALTLAAGLLGSLLAGCAGGPVPPVKDPAKGEFYTGPELIRLPAEERARYCTWMETAQRDLKGSLQALKVRLDSLGVVADTLRAQEISISGKTRDLANRVRDLRLREKASNTYTVAPGDNLRKISRTVYGDGTHSREIWEANKAKIATETSDLKPGTQLTIPRLKDQ
jgi:nucleoid-associated protein YgaU